MSATKLPPSSSSLLLSLLLKLADEEVGVVDVFTKVLSLSLLSKVVEDGGVGVVLTTLTRSDDSGVGGNPDADSLISSTKFRFCVG